MKVLIGFFVIFFLVSCTTVSNETLIESIESIDESNEQNNKFDSFSKNNFTEHIEDYNNSNEPMTVFQNKEKNKSIELNSTAQNTKKFINLSEYEFLDDIDGIIKVEEGRILDFPEGDIFLVRLTNSSQVKIRTLGVNFVDVKENKIDFWLQKGINRYTLRFCHDEGYLNLNTYAKGKNVILYKDENLPDKDSDGNLQRYIVVDDEFFIDFINLQLLSGGYALVDQNVNCILCDYFKEVEKEASEYRDTCIWRSKLQYECDGLGC